MEAHIAVIQALQNMPGIDMRIEGLHDVPQRVLQASAKPYKVSPGRDVQSRLHKEQEPSDWCTFIHRLFHVGCTSKPSDNTMKRLTHVMILLLTSAN